MIFKDSDPELSRRGLIGVFAGSVLALTALPGEAEAKIPSTNPETIDLKPPIDDKQFTDQPRDYEKINHEQLARIHHEIAGKSADDIIAIADAKMLEAESNGLVDFSNPDLKDIGVVGLNGIIKGGLLTADAAIMYAVAYHVIMNRAKKMAEEQKEPAEENNEQVITDLMENTAEGNDDKEETPQPDPEETRKKLRRAIAACHGGFALLPLLGTKAATSAMEQHQDKIIGGISLLALAGISYLSLADLEDPDPEELVDEAEKKAVLLLVAATPVILVSIDAATATGGAGPMDEQGYDFLDYLVSIGINVATILAILKGQDWLLDKRSANSEDKEENENKADPGMIKQGLAKLYGIDNNDEELDDKLLMKGVVTTLISSYGFNGLLNANDLKNPGQFLSFSPTSLAMAGAFSVGLSRGSNYLDGKRST